MKYLNSRLSVTNRTFYPIFFKHYISLVLFTQKNAGQSSTCLLYTSYSSLSTLTVNDFYRNLAAELGAQPAFRKTDNFKIIQDEINRLVLEKRQTPVIIIDEANYIGNAVLNDLKMLFNFEMDSKDRAVVCWG